MIGEQHSASTPNRQETGILGENLVAEWLQAQGWEILHRRWRCRWGELDLIALGEERGHFRADVPESPIVLFVEVKTRSQGNWDADGMLAMSEAKQAKLWQAAEIFLSTHPELANCPCRFDVALVRCHRAQPDNQPELTSTVAIGQPIRIGDCCLTLQEYIESAFSQSSQAEKLT